MASHHRIRHHSTAASYCYCCSPYSPSHHHPPPPPPPDCYPVFHPPPQPHLYSAQTHLPNLHQYHPHFQQRWYEEEIENQHTISSLLRRIAALESALRSRSSSSSSRSLRDAAARTIQTHFRAFLLRRSRTLRQLKDLAYIKSALSILKSSVSKQTHFDYDVVYHQAMELVLKLDAIQGGDPMIRDGKISVRRELSNFFDFIDGFYLERRGVSNGVNMRYERGNVKFRVPNGGKKVGNVKCGGLKSVNMEKLRGLAERIDKLAEELDEEEIEVIEIPNVSTKKHGDSGNKTGGLVKRLGGVQPKVKKSVSFADNGKVYRVLRRNSEPILDENDDDSIDRVRDLEDDLCREVEEIGVTSKEADDDDDDEEVEAQSENGGSMNSSDGERDVRSHPRNGVNFERKMYNQGGADKIAYSAPLPLKMETRADVIDKRKKLANNV
ncbi:hypothetical protein DH2020_009282 [Rehmannia glutinosa]|uniref:BAG family molecular chaperone regulator 8, chloroplastic n=1 Tax=Rehmannia glutinosa TaxID=99300 RepID=A0ABR0X6H3_REHGL